MNRHRIGTRGCPLVVGIYVLSWGITQSLAQSAPPGVDPTVYEQAHKTHAQKTWEANQRLQDMINGVRPDLAGAAAAVIPPAAPGPRTAAAMPRAATPLTLPSGVTPWWT